MFKILRSLRSSKRLKTTVELMFTTQKANACSLWTACFAFDWKYLFRVNLVQKLEINSLSWNFVSRLIQICRILWWCSRFFVLDCANLVQKIKIVSLNLNLNMQNYVVKICGAHFFCFRPEKPFFVCKSCQKNKNCQPKLKFGTKTNLNMQNSIMIFLFLTININIFPGQIWSKISKLFLQS